jgi:endoglucanase
LDQNKVSYINWSVGNKDETSAALKPGATPADVCANSKDTESGEFVKAMLKEKNPPPKNCPGSSTNGDLF